MGIQTTLRIAPAVLLALGVAVAAAEPPRVATHTVSGAAPAAVWVVDGTLEAVHQATVAAQLSGNVTALLVKAGDRVQAGQVLARIDDRDAQAAVQRSEAAAAQADAEWRNARAHASRTQELRAQGFVSAAALDQAGTQLEAARGALQQAQAVRQQAQLARGHASVQSPLTGVVQATWVQAGDLATPGRPLLTVVQPGDIRAIVHVPASTAAAARGAKEIDVQLPDGRWVASARRTELPSTDPVSQTVEWRFDLPASQTAGAQPGQAVRVRFSGASASGAPTTPSRLLVPASALVRRGELSAVYVAQDGAFALRAVRTGADRGAAGVEVIAGLRSGERVAVDGVRAGLSGAKPAP